LKGYRQTVQESQFQRVLEIGGLPEFLPRIDRLDVDRLFKVRDSQEAREFREWLRTVDMATDEEIRNRVTSFRSKAASIFQSPAGRIARFLTTTGVGFTGVIPGVVVGAIDTFLVDKILPTSGVWSFVNTLYPSIFTAKKQE
jgi:hypothetical protein